MVANFRKIFGGIRALVEDISKKVVVGLCSSLHFSFLGFLNVVSTAVWRLSVQACSQMLRALWLRVRGIQVETFPPKA